MKFFLKAMKKAGRILEYSVAEHLMAETILPPVLNTLSKVVRIGQVQNPPRSAEIRDVLVWNIDSLGDSLWITPTLRALRAGLPGARISLVCNGAVKEVFETNPRVNEVIPVEAAQYYSALGWLRPVRELRGRHFDLMVILEMGSRPADRARLWGQTKGARYVISSEMGLLKALPHHLLPPNGDESWPLYFLRSAAHLGITQSDPELASPRLEIFPSREDRQKAEDLLNTLPGNSPWVGLQPCVAPYANLTKKWPLKNYLELAGRLIARRKVRFVISGSPAEKAECDALAAEIGKIQGNGGVLVTAGKLGIRETAALFAHLSALVVGDTAALHLASAVGTPTVALFGATRPATIAPPSATVLTAGLGCSPCHKPRDRIPFWPRCIHASPLCLERIEPAWVEQHVEGILAR